MAQLKTRYVANYLVPELQKHGHQTITFMEQAIVTWRQEDSALKRLKAIAKLEAFSESYRHTKLAPLDEEFFELCKTSDLRQSRITYVRHHPQEFVTAAETPAG